MPNMDYSLIHRTPDGTGKILVTTPGNPNKGSYVEESDMKNYVNQGMVAIADIVDDLVTADTAKPLSANQGVVLKQLIDAFSGGIVPKGDILSTNLPPADDTNKGWQYYCTDINQWATSDGTQWIMTSNSIITQTPDIADTGHALSNAVVTQCCNEVKGKLDQHESRLENLEQKAGDYTTVQYRGTNAVPTGKAKNGLVEKIVGKTRAWNQLVQNGNFADTSGWESNYASISVSSNKCVFTSTTANSNQSLYRDVGLTAGHKYLYICTVKLSEGTSLFRINLSGNFSNVGSISANTKTTIMQIVSVSSISYGQMYLYPNGDTGLSVGETCEFENIIIRDLTLIFGSGNEPSTVADALAQLPALGQYNAYDAGSLVDTEVSGVKSISRNLLDSSKLDSAGTWSGDILDTTASRIHSVTGSKGWDGIKFKPYTQYYARVKLSAGSGLNYIRVQIKYTDGSSLSGNAISGGNTGYSYVLSEANKTVEYFHINYGTGGSVAVQVSEFIINLHDSSDGTFTPFKTDTLSLSETVTLRSAGSVAEVLTLETGKKTRPIRVIDLGSLEWNVANYGGGQVYFGYALIPDAKKAISSQSFLYNNSVCSKYALQTRTDVYGGSTGYAMDGASNIYIYVFEPSLSSSSTTGADFANAMLGTKLAYELETPDPDKQVCDPIIDNFIEIEGGGTIDTIQEQTPVIDNCLDVGYLTL